MSEIRALEGYVRRTGQNRRIWHFVEPGSQIETKGSSFGVILCGANIRQFSLHLLPDGAPLACLHCQSRAKKIMEGKK
jgi:hypothetical protein